MGGQNSNQHPHQHHWHYTNTDDAVFIPDLAPKELHLSGRGTIHYA